MLCRMESEIDDAIYALYARTCCSICLNCYKDLSRKDCVHFHKFGLTNRVFSHMVVTVKGSSSRRMRGRCRQARLAKRQSVPNRKQQDFYRKSGKSLFLCSAVRNRAKTPAQACTLFGARFFGKRRGNLYAVIYFSGDRLRTHDMGCG